MNIIDGSKLILTSSHDKIINSKFNTPPNLQHSANVRNRIFSHKDEVEKRKYKQSVNCQSSHHRCNVKSKLFQNLKNDFVSFLLQRLYNRGTTGVARNFDWERPKIEKSLTLV